MGKKHISVAPSSGRRVQQRGSGSRKNEVCHLSVETVGRMSMHTTACAESLRLRRTGFVHPTPFTGTG